VSKIRRAIGMATTGLAIAATLVGNPSVAGAAPPACSAISDPETQATCFAFAEDVAAQDTPGTIDDGREVGLTAAEQHGACDSAAVDQLGCSSEVAPPESDPVSDAAGIAQTTLTPESGDVGPASGPEYLVPGVPPLTSSNTQDPGPPPPYRSTGCSVRTGEICPSGGARAHGACDTSSLGADIHRSSRMRSGPR